jgi:hypothetical protein
MLIMRKAAWSLAGCLLLAGCGQQVGSSGTGQARSGTAVAMSECASGVDRGEVLDAMHVHGADVIAWMKDRDDGGVADDKVEQLSKVDVVTACLLQGDFAYPHPEPLDSDQPSDVGPVKAIELVGVEKQAQIDSIGPAPAVDDLWKMLDQYALESQK